MAQCEDTGLAKCSDCGMSPWGQHCGSCEPCVQKRAKRAEKIGYRRGTEEAARVAKSAGYPSISFAILAMASLKEETDGD